MSRTLRCTVHLLSLTVLLALGASCNVIGVAAQSINTDESKALFVPAKRPTVVVAERYANPSQSAMDDEPLARFLTDDLREQNVVPLIDPDHVYTMRKGMTAEKWHAMTVDSVGRTLNAEQVLYVNILDVSTTIEPGTGMMRGQAEARIRLVDAQTGNTIWPTDATDGYPIAVHTPLLRMNETSVNDHEVRSVIIRSLADRIAKLFYTYSRN